MRTKKYIIVIVLVGVIATSCFLLFSKQIANFIFNHAPSIESYSPSGKNLEVNEGYNMTLFVSTSDPDGDALLYTWLLSNQIVFEEVAGTHSSCSWVYTPQYGDRGQHTVECRVSDGRGGRNSVSWIVTVCYVELHASLNEGSVYGGEWLRDKRIDLPMYQSALAYSISNHGTGVAYNVEYEIYLDEYVCFENVIPELSPHESYTDQIQFQLSYDSRHQFSIEASAKYSNDTDSFIFEAIFPRSPSSSNLKKLYVTPNDPIVKNTVDSIMKSKFILYPGWMAIKDWCSSNIKYSYDSDRYGREYWQLPRETIQSGYGDCEDFSILMVSLLRAAGWSIDEVYAVEGKPKTGSGSWHVWVRLNVDIIGWQNLEPQSGTVVWLLLGDYFWLGNFDDVYGFNDVSYIKL